MREQSDQLQVNFEFQAYRKVAILFEFIVHFELVSQSQIENLLKNQTLTSTVQQI